MLHSCPFKRERARTLVWTEGPELTRGVLRLYRGYQTGVADSLLSPAQILQWQHLKHSRVTPKTKKKKKRKKLFY